MPSAFQVISRNQYAPFICTGKINAAPQCASAMNNGDTAGISMYVCAVVRQNNATAPTVIMKIIITTFLIVLSTGSALCLSACAHRQPKSSFRIIENGDPNPYITDDPTRAGTVIRRADTPR